LLSKFGKARGGLWRLPADNTGRMMIARRRLTILRPNRLRCGRNDLTAAEQAETLTAEVRSQPSESMRQLARSLYRKAIDRARFGAGCVLMVS